MELYEIESIYASRFLKGYSIKILNKVEIKSWFYLKWYRGCDPDVEKNNAKKKVNWTKLSSVFSQKCT